MYGIMRLKKGGKTKATGWTPGKGGSKASKDYYREKKKEYTSPQAVASRELDQIVRAGKEDQDYKGGTSGAGRVIADMSKKNQDFMMRNRRKDGSFNSAAMDLLGNYWDDRSDYQRDLNQYITSSPMARQTYLDRFPVGGALNLGIPAAFNAFSKLAIPEPIRALGTAARDVATLGGRGLKALVPKQIRKDVGPGLQKVWGDVKDAPGNLLRDAKGILTGKLSPIETANLGIIKDEQQNVKEDLVRGPNTTDDIVSSVTEEILGKEDQDAWMRENITYDPTKDVDTRTSGPDEVEDWMGEIQPRISGALDQTDLTQEEDIFDVSQNRMPHVPITQEQKKKIVDQSGMLVPNYLENNPEDTDYLYNFVREQQEKGLEYKPGWEGVINKPTWDDPFVWQAPGHDELVDQIEWNTANRPLDWSGGETPELTEEFIQENFKTGSDLWDFNQGGYLEKYDDGGYANMSTFEKLKAINDSIAEG